MSTEALSGSQQTADLGEQTPSYSPPPEIVTANGNQPHSRSSDVPNRTESYPLELFYEREESFRQRMAEQQKRWEEEARLRRGDTQDGKEVPLRGGIPYFLPITTSVSASDPVRSDVAEPTV